MISKPLLVTILLLCYVLISSCRRKTVKRHAHSRDMINHNINNKRISETCNPREMKKIGTYQLRK